LRRGNVCYNARAMDDSVTTKQGLQNLGKELRDEMSRQLTALTELVAAGFETMDERFDRLETRADKLEERLKRLETRMNRVERQLRDLSGQVDQLDGRVSALQADVVALYRMNGETRHQFAARLKNLPEHDRRLKQLEAFAADAVRRLGVEFS